VLAKHVQWQIADVGVHGEAVQGIQGIYNNASKCEYFLLILK
jgi:hypothetical protein